MNGTGSAGFTRPDGTEPADRADPTTDRLRERAYSNAARSVVPNLIDGVAPLDTHATRSAYVFAVPIDDEGLSVWHRFGERRYLLANLVIAAVLERLRTEAQSRGETVLQRVSGEPGAPSLVSLGALAGLGSRGKNNVLVNSRLGPWMQLGAVEVAPALDPSSEDARDLCGDCRACIEACPAGALDLPVFNPRACAFLVASPHNLRSRARALTDRTYIECDACLRACPWGTPPERVA